jgi:hypothetical protein
MDHAKFWFMAKPPALYLEEGLPVKGLDLKGEVS